jgi:hypothetical protein
MQVNLVPFLVVPVARLPFFATEHTHPSAWALVVTTRNAKAIITAFKAISPRSTLPGIEVAVLLADGSGLVD